MKTANTEDVVTEHSFHAKYSATWTTKFHDKTFVECYKKSDSVADVR
jgi:hypothetical protein